MKMTMIICDKCGMKCEKPSKEILRQINKGKTKFYCSLSCSTSATRTIHHSVICKCLWCNNEFETTTHKRSKKYCSRKCIREFARTHLDKTKLSNSIKKVWDSGVYGKRILEPRVYDFTCVICNQPFQRFTKKLIPQVKTCSKKCYSKLVSKNSRENPNCGGELGYRHYTYKDFIMDSSWEVEIAKWMDENKIKWDRSRKKYMFWWTDDNGDKRRYYPDFYLPEYNIYLDPKNKYKMENDRVKMERVIKENGITLFWGLLENVKKEVDILRKV